MMICSHLSPTDDALSQHTAELGVTALPAFHFYKNGKQALEAVSGYKKRPLSDAVEQLSKK